MEDKLRLLELSKRFLVNKDEKNTSTYIISFNSCYGDSDLKATINTKTKKIEYGIEVGDCYYATIWTFEEKDFNDLREFCESLLKDK